MSVKTRSIGQVFAQTHGSKYKNLLVSGCSFTYNNSETHSCTWPYYLRDLVGFTNVYDASQSGAGSNHIFNSIVYECETNPFINPEDTLVVVMWSGLSRTDVIAEKTLTKSWHTMSNYCYDQRFATLSIFNGTNGNSMLDQFCQQYKKLVNIDAQVLESLIKAQALKHYLQSKGFNHVFLSWMDPEEELSHAKATMTLPLDSVAYLYEFAKHNGLLEPDQHPSPDGHLRWTRECLLPYLTQQQLTTDLDPV